MCVPVFVFQYPVVSGTVFNVIGSLIIKVAKANSKRLSTRDNGHFMRCYVVCVRRDFIEWACEACSEPVSPSIKMSSSFVRTGWTMVFKVVAGNLVSRNIQEFWSSNSGLNLQDIEALNVGSSVKTSYKSRYVKQWTSIKPKKVEAAKQRFSLFVIIENWDLLRSFHISCS